MSEILFRGKRMDNGEWVRGYPFSYQTGIVVEGIETWDGERHRIDPSTVGQYTGVVDKNGDRIFEGDFLALASSRLCEVKFAYGSFYLDGSSIPLRFGEKFTIAGNRWDNKKPPNYEELIQRLRADTYTFEELSIILPQAADAIEKLSKPNWII